MTELTPPDHGDLPAEVPVLPKEEPLVLSRMAWAPAARF
jgi:hypothetical protein